MKMSRCPGCRNLYFHKDLYPVFAPDPLVKFYAKDYNKADFKLFFYCGVCRYLLAKVFPIEIFNVTKTDADVYDECNKEI